ncbi:unnamed protein product [Acanthoscelides obtectus]|uniref:Uncharacterized protein n=1 Tax=Acanthoscelides obtectus TaxID=200917 RepID=A0A9P0Q0Z8_ACAOB|nr:unnamed protein product [Acanthoscelides obtectus]CAK1624188.1 hypothetical protein AOBTE_LOCUS2384 [Acanthoscelides obtectus]
MNISTTSCSTSPFKIKPCHLRPSHAGTVEAVEDEKSGDGISCFESGSHLSPFVVTSSASDINMTEYQ